MWIGINGDKAMTIDSHYYLGCGNRGGCEREVVYWVDDGIYYIQDEPTPKIGGYRTHAQSKQKGMCCDYRTNRLP